MTLVDEVDVTAQTDPRSDVSHEAIENLSHEDRAFAPSREFAAQANATAALYDEAAADRVAFWERQAGELQWETPWTTALDWSAAPFVRWFDGGRLNVAVNCVDRHVEAGHGDQVAYHFEGEPGDTRDITYAELLTEVSQAANALESLGVKAGDRVAIYLPMIPEAVISMLACARIGAVHSVVFGGFSAEALRSRIDDAQAVLVITSDGGYRRGAASPLKPAVDEAVVQTPSIRNVLVVRRTGGDVEWVEGRDHWWHDLVERQATTHEAQHFDAEHPLFILYTSGTTGKPKGILHTTGGYLTQAAYTLHKVFDLKAATDV
jgi:acetyl-CoA synthetase